MTDERTILALAEPQGGEDRRLQADNQSEEVGVDEEVTQDFNDGAEDKDWPVFVEMYRVDHAKAIAHFLVRLIR